MHGNFLELLFKGMERNPGYTPECINLIILTGKACTNEILQKLCRTGEKMANNNLLLLNRIFLSILDNEKTPEKYHSNSDCAIFGNLNESFKFFTSVLLGNITRNIRKNASLLILFGLLNHKSLDLTEVSITRNQSTAIITSLNSLASKMYDVSVIPAMLQVIRFLSRAYLFRKELIDRLIKQGSEKDKSPKNSNQIQSNNLKNENIYEDIKIKYSINCYIVDEFITNIDNIISSI